jgi:lipopolysaccharide biosynthesis protein
MKTLVTFVHYNKLGKSIHDSIYRENLNFFCEVGLTDSADHQFNFVINSPTGGEQIPDMPNVSVINGHNRGYDFGGYKQSLENVNLENFDRYIFMNDTCRGPFIPNYVPESVNWLDMFLKDLNEKVKLVGPTWFTDQNSNFLKRTLKVGPGQNNHIQSWCFGLDKFALQLLIKHNKFDAEGKTRKQIIKHHEIGMSRLLLDNGFQIKPFQLSRSHEAKHTGICKPKGYFGMDVNPLEIMFFKTKPSGKPTTINNRLILTKYTQWICR